MIIDNVNYTLRAKYNTTERHVILHSTAEFNAMENMTITCEDGLNESKTCEVQVISECMHAVRVKKNCGINYN